MRSLVIVIVLPLSQLLIEQVDIVRDAVTVEQLVELLVVDAVRPLDFAIQVRRARTDVDVADVPRLEVPVELGLELGAVVGLDDVHTKRQPPHDLIGEVMAVR